jgi:hypothetical protein
VVVTVVTADMTLIPCHQDKRSGAMLIAWHEFKYGLKVYMVHYIGTVRTTSGLNETEISVLNNCFTKGNRKDSLACLKEKSDFLLSKVQN